MKTYEQRVKEILPEAKLVRFDPFTIAIKDGDKMIAKDSLEFRAWHTAWLKLRHDRSLRK